MVVAIFGRPGALLDKNGVAVRTLSNFYPARSDRSDAYLYLKPLKFGTEPNVEYGVSRASGERLRRGQQGS